VPGVGTPRATRRAHPVIRAIVFGVILVLGWLIVIELGVAIYHVFVSPIPPSVLAQIESLPLALVYSLGRIAGAYAISVAFVLPLAIFLVSRPRAFRIGLPIVEIVASIPASSLFPLFIIALSPFVGLNGIAILLLVTGMAWYLFFNVISGLRAVPSDLKEAAVSYGLSRWQYYRRLVLPAIVPAFVTGSITAVGSGWNTLVFAEYFQVNGVVELQVLGVGQLISIASIGSSSIVWSLWIASLFTLILTVIVLNELLWKPLYRRATTKYRID
jgi:NitT/TauT family transport system permease protein